MLAITVAYDSTALCCKTGLPAVSRNMQYKTAELRQRERSHRLVWAFEAVAAIHSEASWSERASSAHPTRRLINAGSHRKERPREAKIDGHDPGCYFSCSVAPQGGIVGARAGLLF